MHEAIEVPSTANDALGRAAREAGAYVVIGVVLVAVLLALAAFLLYQRFREFTG